MCQQDAVNILLVDDQPAKLLSYEVVLQELGENLIRASSAREAFEHLLRTEVAVILIDVVMPDLDGFELATMIREHPRFERTAIIFVSAIHMTDLDRLRGYEVGAVDYLPVPVVPDLLRAKVRLFVDLYRKTRQLERLNTELERRVKERTIALETSTARLQESEQRRSLALAAGHMGSWEWDLASDAQIWDEGQHCILGTDAFQFAPTGEAAMAFVHQEDREGLQAVVVEAIRNGSPYNTEFRIVQASGDIRWCVIGAAPTLDRTGRPTRFSGVTHDITERKKAEAALRESEERLRIAQETSGIGIWDWDLISDQIVHIGEVYRSWGVDRDVSEPPSATFQRIVHPDDRSAAWTEIQAAIHGERPYQLELRIVGMDGTIRWLASRAEVIRDRTGRPIRIIGTDIDVTERRRAADILAEANAELERRVEERTRESEAALAQVHEMQKMESLGKVTGGVAHDFNNLLMAILGNLSLLRKRLTLDARTARLVDGAIQGAERGAALTKRMLAFARRQELKPQAIDVEQLVQGMTDLLRQSLGPAVEVVLDFSASMPPLKIDPNQLELALLNLAVNARDAMPMGGRFTIAAQHGTSPEPSLQLPSGRYVCVSVADTGVGMDEGTLKRATEPFFTTKEVGKGTGLGLSMVHGLAAQSGGAMRIVSRPGFGTVVELWLPVAKDGSNVKTQAGPEAAPVAHARPVQSCRVLLVDDDPLIRTGTLAMLEDLGHVVVEASSAAQAFDILSSGEVFDLVVTDFAMPGATGLELTERIEARWPGLPILLVTGYADLAESEFGGRARLSKPYGQDQLAAQIMQLVAAPSESNVIPMRPAQKGG
jgi:PAS domain S-box-containing protein